MCEEVTGLTARMSPPGHVQYTQRCTRGRPRTCGFEPANALIHRELDPTQGWSIKVGSGWVGKGGFVPLLTSRCYSITTTRSALNTPEFGNPRQDFSGAHQFQLTGLSSSPSHAFDISNEWHRMGRNGGLSLCVILCKCTDLVDSGPR